METYVRMRLLRSGLRELPSQTDREPQRAAPDWRNVPSDLPRREARNVDFMFEELERGGCVECGDDICVLDLDHVGKKRGSVALLARSGYGRSRLLQEMAECEIRCANCHRRRTAKERGY